MFSIPRMDQYDYKRDSLCVVDVKEVRVENRLDDARNHRYWVVEALDPLLCKVAVYPVGDIQGPVRAKCKQVVRRDCFCFARPLQHEQLREYRDCLKPYRERPEYLRVPLAPLSTLTV
jgi:hypothetical protein